MMWHDMIHPLGIVWKRKPFGTLKVVLLESKAIFLLFVLGEKPNKEGRWGPKVKGEKIIVSTQMLPAES